MNRQLVGQAWRYGWAPWLIAPALLLAADRAQGYEPTSPEVQEALDKAVKFLETDSRPDERYGASQLVGLALLKHGVARDHVIIEEAVEEVQGVFDSPRYKEMKIWTYEIGLSILFLVELDSNKYRPEIEKLLEYLLKSQKPHGGWGYPDRTTGDTSMTQYGVLCSWEASKAGFAIPQDSTERVCDWLIKTQDPSGAWGYQGVVSSRAGELVNQNDVRESLAAAGLGSLYICCDLLGMNRKLRVRTGDVPEALEEVKPETAEGGGAQKVLALVSARGVRETRNRGNRWMEDNYTVNPVQYAKYYLYAFERYHAFCELAQGRMEKEPKWYNDGVEFLLEDQNDNGSWSAKVGTTAGTAFAMLFLLRSSKKSIQKIRNFGDGTMVGGRGLPKDTDNVVVRRGQVVARPLLGPAEQLLATLEDVDQADFGQTADLLADLPPQDAQSVLAKHAEKLRSLAANPSAEARIMAVRGLGKTRNLDNVPTLIYALTDPDWDVVREARDGLRRTSRRPAGFGLADRPTEAERQEAIEKWKAWYLAIRPDGEFGD